ncbi:MAG: acyltransferase family protein [Tissierellia bacterium]|nr:acyltransferase family protein [Tissierellia bacterium]
MVEKGVINYLNFIKGVCIILVILLHSIPYAHWRISLAGAWLDQAVPIFLFITAYLTYYSFERGKNFKIYFSINSFKKMINRIFFPFLFLIIIQLTILPIIGHQMPAKQVVMWGGVGPGSYYPWLYLQAWFFIPIIIYIVQKLSIVKSIIIVLGSAVLIECFLSFIDIHPNIYRLLFTRHIFILYLGCIMRKYEFKLSISTIVLGITSLFAILLLVYGGINLKPLFTGYWVSQQWMTSFYPFLIFIIIRDIYKHIDKCKITSLINKFGIYSYEIFLTQMFLFSLDFSSIFRRIPNIAVAIILYFIIMLFFSITPVIIFKKMRLK